MTRLMLRGAALIVILLVVPRDGAAQRRSISRLSWLTGCWQQTKSQTVVEEQWTHPGGRMMLGMGRTIGSDTTVSFEMMRIFARRQRLIFEARPNGGAPVEFVTIDTSTRVLDFRNRENVFPQRVVYRYVTQDSVEAFIEGTRQNRRGEGVARTARPLRVDYAYHRVSCEPTRDSLR